MPLPFLFWTRPLSNFLLIVLTFPSPFPWILNESVGTFLDWKKHVSLPTQNSKFLLAENYCYKNSFCLCLKYLSCFGRPITKEQHGFQKKTPTITNLMGFTNFVAQFINSRRKDVLAIYTDITAVLDCVNDILLLNSSDRIYHTIPQSVISWFSYYLSGRVSRISF